jgi:hypothetical protein
MRNTLPFLAIRPTPAPFAPSTPTETSELDFRQTAGSFSESESRRNDVDRVAAADEPVAWCAICTTHVVRALDTA